MAAKKKPKYVKKLMVKTERTDIPADDSGTTDWQRQQQEDRKPGEERARAAPASKKQKTTKKKTEAAPGDSMDKNQAEAGRRLKSQKWTKRTKDLEDLTGFRGRSG
jgi:hypothetical protein